MAELGLVHGHNHGGETHANASQGSTAVHVVDVLRAGLQGATETEDDGADKNRDLAAEFVARWAGEEGAYKGASRKDGDDCAAGLLVSMDVSDLGKG